MIACTFACVSLCISNNAFHLRPSSLLLPQIFPSSPSEFGALYCEDVVTSTTASVTSAMSAGRHVYSLITGFLLIYYPFGNGVFHAFVPAMITYFAMLAFRRQCGKLAWLIDFTYLIGW